MIKNKVWKFSLALILLNVLIGSVVIFNQYTINSRVNVAKAGYDRQVLGTSSNVPVFSPNFVISDDTFRSTRVFPSQASVQSYLDSVGSPLRNYTTGGQSASYWIFGAARGTTSSKYGITPNINPGVILAYLEKEQSLISYKNYDTYNDPESRIKTAMGYGCPDQAKCDSTYYGFANQVNWAAYQLELNYQQAGTNGGGTNYIKNSTIATLDEYNVFLTNQATAAQYRYTPHVYWGNYNLWKIITANGWGVDPNTYSMSQIDSVNLANKDIKVGAVNYGITRDQVDAILKTKYNFGDSSDNIKTLQKFLRQEGYYTTREINGMYGTITKGAHETYLIDKGIAFNTGVSPSQVNDSCKTLIAQNWNKYQEYGDEGKNLQECLRKIGVFDWPINTGYVGDVTITALAQGRLILGVGNAASTQISCSSLKSTSIPFGETSERVRQLQACMRAEGVFNWANGDTGYFGPVTQEAFQKWSTTAKSATPAVAGVSSSSCESLKTQTIPFGETSERVKQLQACMRAAGFFSWPLGDTGYNGPVTVDSYARWTNKSINQTFSCSDLKTQTWTKGETSSRVKQLQGCMRSAGVFNWAQGDTGYFGDATEEAIIKWRGYL